MYAVIRTGGKQYKVAPQDVLQIEKIEGDAGDAVNFSDVLMVAGEGSPTFGAPLVSGAAVSAEVVEQGRGPKVIIFKKKRRQNYRRKRGHRQELTTVRILEILTGGKAPAKAAQAKPTEASTAEAPAAEAKKPRAKTAETSE
jgi:large subunit ribosomal protein L21